MFRNHRTRAKATPEVPVELRFIDLFMIIVAALIFLVISLSFIIFLPSPRKPSPLQITTASLPPVLQGIRYDMYLAGRGGRVPYRWKLIEGKLPAELSFDEENGLIHGTPYFPEIMHFTIELMDALGAAVRREFKLEVLARIQSDRLRFDGYTAALPEAVTYKYYRYQFKVFGGTPPYTFSVAQDKLPKGLQLSSDGILMGMVELLEFDSNLAKPWSFEIAIKDHLGMTSGQNVVLPVKFEPPPSKITGLARWLVSVGKAVLAVILWVLCLALKLVMLAAFLLGLCSVFFMAYGFRGGNTIGWRGLLQWKRGEDEWS